MVHSMHCQHTYVSILIYNTCTFVDNMSFLFIHVTVRWCFFFVDNHNKTITIRQSCYDNIIYLLSGFC